MAGPGSVASHAGKVAVCIGSARGIGARTAERLAAGGAKVVIGDIEVERAERTVAGIRERGGEASALPCDISSEDAVAAFVQGAIEQYDRIDLAHLNAADVAAGAKDMDLLTGDIALFDRTIAVNLRGHLVCTRQIVPHMLRQGRGAIVYTSSDAVYTSGRSLYFYRMSKAGLNSLMRQVASLYGAQGVRANVVSPGFIQMDEGEHMMDDAFQRAHLAATPSTRLGETRDVAAMAEFLLSDLAEWVNGQTISVNGGYQMRG